MKKGLILMAAIGCLAVAAPAADVVGLLSTVSGTVQIVRAGQSAPVAARTADLIGAGDRIITGKNSDATFVFCPSSKAAKITADSDVEFQASAYAAKKGKLADERTLPACRLPTSLTLAYASQQQAGMPRYRGAQLVLISPSQTNIATLKPRFVWVAVDSAKHYDIKLMDREERVLWKQTVTTTEVDYPADAKPIVWGQKYWWRVTARDSEETLSEIGSFFQVLPSELADKVRSTEAALRKSIQSSPDDNAARFLLAFTYEENGMLHDAARVYAEIAARMGTNDWVHTRRAELANKLGWDKVDR